MAYKEIDLGGGYSQRIYSEYKAWYFNGKRHREHGPAIEYASGYKAWYLNGERHRKDGPAIEYESGHKPWYINGVLHREDGPAIEGDDGFKEWWLNGVEVTAEIIGFIIKRKRKLASKYWLLWTDYLMNPTTERGRKYANRQYDKLEDI